MIPRDRALLARLSRINRHLGDLVIELLHHQHDGHLPADALTALADHLTALAHDLRTHATETETVTDQPTSPRLAAALPQSQPEPADSREVQP